MYSKQLKRYGELRGGCGFPLEEQGYSSGEMEIPFFKVKDLSAPKYLESTDNHISRETAQRLGATIFPSGTIVFAKVGAALLLNRFRILMCEGCIDNNMMALTLNKGLSTDYFYFLLNMVDLSQDYNQGPVPSVNTRQIGSIRADVCHPDRQENIAAYLETSCTGIDAAVAAKQQQIDVLERLRRSTIQRAITRGLEAQPALKPTENAWLEQIPERWSLVMLKRLAEIQTGLTLGKNYDAPLIERPYLRVANVQDGHLDLDEITTIEVPQEVADRVLLQLGDVLMTEGGDLDKLGRGYVWNGEIDGCLHQNHIFAVRCIPHRLLPKFLAYTTASQYGRDYFEATGKRTTNLAATNSTKVGAFPIPLPPLTMQQEIVTYIDREIERFKAIQALLNRQIDTLTAYRKSLIYECVTGKRQV